MKAQTQELSEVVLNNQVLVERDRAEGVNISSPSRKRISIFLTEWIIFFVLLLSLFDADWQSVQLVSYFTQTS